MKKRILLTTAMERSTRILLRSSLMTYLRVDYDVIVASPAEKSQTWKDEFSDCGVQFFSDITDDYKKLSIYMHYGIDLVLSAENNDVPAHAFDIQMQTQAIREHIPVIVLQTFIDTIFHPMKIIPDKYICWGNFFANQLSENRNVLLWDNLRGGIGGSTSIEGMMSDSLAVGGSIVADDYDECLIRTKNQICDPLQIDSEKPIFLYIPNGDFSEWSYKMADDLFSCAREYEASVIVKAHPMRHFDSWIYNIVASKYPEVVYRLVHSTSFNKGTAIGIPGYDTDRFKLDNNDTNQLAELFSISDIVNSCGSTANIESMIFDIPNIIHTGYWAIAMPIRQKMLVWYRDLIGNQYQACDLVSDRDSLSLSIQQNLENPAKNKEGRQKLVKDFFHSIDGKSGMRTFVIIDKFMKDR